MTVTQGGVAINRTAIGAPRRRVWGAPAAAIAAGLGTGAAIVLARLSGVLTGMPALATMAVVALAVPTAASLSRRLLLTGALAAGLAPLVWLVHLPSPGPAGLVMAATGGWLATWVLWRGPRATTSRARALVPRVQRVDALPVLAAAGGAWVLSPWLRVKDGAHALAALLPGWDHSAHYDMTMMIRTHGVTVDRLAGSGVDWKFADYPQGHHSLAALLMDAVAPVPGTAIQELVLYVHAQAWILVLAGVLVAAGLCTVGWLRTRPMVALPAVTLAVAALVAGPGGHAYIAGFVNFVPACALAAATVFVARDSGRRLAPLPLAALAALLVAVAHDWVLLLACALPAAIVAVPQLTREARQASRLRVATTIAIVVAGVAGALHVAVILHHLSPGATLEIPGGFPAMSIGPLIAALLLAIATALALPGRGTHLAAVPLLGFAAVAALGVYQVLSAGAVSYYFWKLLLGAALVATAVLAASASGLVVRLPRPGRATGVLVSLIATLAATQALGFAGSGRGAFTVDEGWVADASGILAAADRAAQQPSADWSLLLDPNTTAVDPASAQQWLLALTGRWTVSTNAAAETLVGARTADRAALVRARLEADPAARFLVSPAELAPLRAALGAPLADRVLSW